jgi:hypothetical protein
MIIVLITGDIGRGSGKAPIARGIFKAGPNGRRREQN